MIVNTIHIDKILQPYNKTWVGFIAFCEDKLNIQQVRHRKSISILWPTNTRT